MHFGLGVATELKLRMTGPTGSVSPWVGITPNQIARIEFDGQSLDVTRP